MLPSIWRATKADRELAKGDPPAPYGFAGPRSSEHKDDISETSEVTEEAVNPPQDLPNPSPTQPNNDNVAKSTPAVTSEPTVDLEILTDAPEPENDSTNVQSTLLIEDVETIRAALEEEGGDDDLPGVLRVDGGCEDGNELGDHFDDEDRDIVAIISQAENLSDGEDEVERTTAVGLRAVGDKEGLTSVIDGATPATTSPTSSTATGLPATPVVAFPNPAGATDAVEPKVVG